jgi:hypothetical protein
METVGTAVSPANEKRFQHWLRVLRPLSWWVLLVLVLYGIRLHQLWSEQTRLVFSVSLQGQPLLNEASATLDGERATSGQHIAIGSHTFQVTHPKGETFSINWFNWYGEHKLGNIDLKRTKGTLAIAVDPPAPLLSIRGPEWSLTLSNCYGMTSSVPTDLYTVESKYAHWERADEVSVVFGGTATWRIAPRLGAVQLSCNQSNATFQLLALDDRPIESGEFPSSITELPEGNYKLITRHHGHERQQGLVIQARTTNDFPVEFMYGRAVLETEPPDASVQDAAGREWGVTPFKFSELTPGILQLTLHRVGYEPVPVSLQITANEVATFHTNLVSTSYTGAMKSARQQMAAMNYDRALQTIRDALVAKPDDADAIQLRREATGLGKLQHAKMLGERGDYIGGGKELALALQSLPDNGEVKQLIGDFKSREPEQIERERVERLNRPKRVYDEILGRNKDANLFDDHELKTSKPAKDAASAIASALLYGQPVFKINVNRSPQPETYEIMGQQDVSVGLFSVGGKRQCIIVCGQTRDDETVILFKVLEYKTKHNVTMPGLLEFRDDLEYIPIHPSRITNMTDKLKAQLQAGVSNLTLRIQGAIGQTPAPAVQPAVSQ